VLTILLARSNSSPNEIVNNKAGINPVKIPTENKSFQLANIGSFLQSFINLNIKNDTIVVASHVIKNSFI
jgi:hypothetical protein